MTLNISNAFVKTPLPESNKRITMKINGKLVEIIMEQFLNKYAKYVHDEGNGLC